MNLLINVNWFAIMLACVTRTVCWLSYFNLPNFHSAVLFISTSLTISCIIQKQLPHYTESANISTLSTFTILSFILFKLNNFIIWFNCKLEVKYKVYWPLIPTTTCTTCNCYYSLVLFLISNLQTKMWWYFKNYC